MKVPLIYKSSKKLSSSAAPFFFFFIPWDIGIPLLSNVLLGGGALVTLEDVLSTLATPSTISARRAETAEHSELLSLMGERHAQEMEPWRRTHPTEWLICHSVSARLVTTCCNGVPSLKRSLDTQPRRTITIPSSSTMTRPMKTLALAVIARLFSVIGPPNG